MKPMLAATIEKIEQLEGRYPFYASPKLDGIRAIVQDNRIISRNLKAIPNRFVQNNLPISRMNGWDGELIVGNPWDKDVFRNTTSGVMSADGEPKFSFWVFDNLAPHMLDCGFHERHQGLKLNIGTLKNARVKQVPQVLVKDAFALYEYEQSMLAKGFEGVMLRSIDGAYKFGRSTVREGHLMKLKQFADSEAIIIGMVEQLENQNEAKRNKLGQIERSSHKINLVGKGTLGAILVRDIKTKVEFQIGTGFDDKLRKMIWNDPRRFLNRVVKYKYFPTGSKDKPRFPVFIGFRDRKDMS